MLLKRVRSKVNKQVPRWYRENASTVAGSSRVKLRHGSIQVCIEKTVASSPTLRSSVSIEAMVCGAHSSRLKRSAFPRRQANSRQATPRNSQHTKVVLCSDTLLTVQLKITLSLHCTHTPGIGANRSLNGHSTTKQRRPIGGQAFGQGFGRTMTEREREVAGCGARALPLPPSLPRRAGACATTSPSGSQWPSFGLAGPAPRLYTAPDNKTARAQGSETRS